MRFVRDAIVLHPITGFKPDGTPVTTATTIQTALTDVVLGDGAASFATQWRDGSRPTILSTLLPTAAYDDDCTFYGNCNGATQIFVHLSTVALGAGGLTGVILLIEPQDPDHPDFYLPSTEGVARTATLAGHEITVLGLGNRILATRVEHFHFNRFRARFRASAGAAGVATQIWISWNSNGGQPMVAAQ